MDQDGANVRYLTRGDDLVLTPRFYPSTQEITYMSFGQGDPRVYLLNIETGQREIVGNFPGMTFAPRFSPDGQRVIMSLQQGGNANLFVMDLRSKQTTRLTDTPAIDTAPCYSPDGSRICFEMRPRRLAADLCHAARRRTGAAHQLRRGTSFDAGWSPRGDYIAFTGQARGNFAIGVLKPDGSGERLLTEGFHNEGPTFAPNGRVMMFFRDVRAGGPRSIRSTSPAATIEGSDTQLRLGSGLVAAFIVMVVNRPYFHPVLTIRNGLRGSGSFIGLRKVPSRLMERSLNERPARPTRMLRSIRVKWRHRNDRYEEDDAHHPARCGSAAALMISACANKTGEDAQANAAGQATPGSQQDFVVNVGDRVFFETDSTELRRSRARRSTSRRSGSRPTATTASSPIEGHADERGTREYNIALGARRAQAVRDYLISRGIRRSACGPSRTARSVRSRSATTSRAGRRTAAPSPYWA